MGEFPSIAGKPLDPLGALPKRVTYDLSPGLQGKLVVQVWQRLFPKEPRMILH